MELFNPTFEKRARIEYEKDFELGQGRFGTVYKGTYQKREVAVKVINQEYSKLAKIEAETLRALDDHPSIVRLHCAEIVGRKICIAVELCGATIQDIKFGGAIEIDKIKIVESITDGLAYLHEKLIVHRDLKPANILIKELSAASRKWQIKIADFNSSKHMQYGGSNDAISFKGTPTWSAPEILLVLRDRLKVNLRWKSLVIKILNYANIKH